MAVSHVNPLIVILAGVPEDPLVCKKGNAAIECDRTQVHKDMERDQLKGKGESTDM